MKCTNPKCRYEWTPRVEKPKSCPECKIRLARAKKEEPCEKPREEAEAAKGSGEMKRLSDTKWAIVVTVGEYNYTDEVEATTEGLYVMGDIIPWEELDTARDKAVLDAIISIRPRPPARRFQRRPARHCRQEDSAESGGEGGGADTGEVA